MSLIVGELAAILDLDSKPFDSKLAGSGDKLGGLKKAGVVAATAISAALVGGAAAGLMSFVGFENRMAEVFTLLPGISQDAMDDMTDQVKSFAKKFGVLPDKVVPALYQALSSGIPKENVFAFLETAQKAAKGGVTDLTTAVDGISSVVNAYGADVLDATHASDLMFTAVKLGKTNFAELSQSLFNVTPTAAALGVSFDQVTAALAAMTVQGVPTSVATTQLRQMLVELSKAGSKTSDAFHAMGDQTFKEFIASGGTLEGALGRLQMAVEEGFAPSLADLFGSVEAGNAALALTGKGAKTFGADLAAMGGSAGATQVAYEQMDQGMSASFDRIKAAGSVMMLEVGEKIAPAVAGAADFIVEHWNLVAPAAAAMATAVAAAFTVVMVQAIKAGEGVVASTLLQVAKWAWLAVQATASAIKVAAAWLISMGPIAVVGAAVVALVALVIANWDKVAAVTAAVFNGIKDFLAQWWPVILGVMTGGLGLVVVAVVKNWDTIKDAVAGAAMTIAGVVTGFIDTVRDIWDTGWSAMSSLVTGIWDGIKSAVKSAVDWILKQIDRLLGPLDEIIGTIGSIGGGLLHKIPGFASGVQNFGGGLAWVGEHGPELVRLPRGADVFPMSSIERSLTAAGSGAAPASIAGPGTAAGATSVEMGDVTVPVYLDGREIARYTVEMTGGSRRNRRAQ